MVQSSFIPRLPIKQALQSSSTWLHFPPEGYVPQPSPLPQAHQPACAVRADCLTSRHLGQAVHRIHPYLAAHVGIAGPLVLLHHDS